MKVLSLFDGISCGRVALERASFEVERYAAFEIDKYAIKVSDKNYPDIERYGDVFEGDYKQFEGFDLLIGGSPCTFWSIAKQGRETGIDGEGGRFFREYVRALHESKCKYFLYENNHSIHKDIKAAISTALGVDYIMINSALVSAQQRKRCYWTNIPGITQPEDRGLLLNDILESGKGINTAKSGKSLTLVATYGKRAMSNILSNKSRRTTGVAEVVCVAQRGRYFNGEDKTRQCIEGRKDGKTNCFTTTTKDNLVAVPIRIGDIGSTGQAQRVYSVHGKSVCLSTASGGQGAATGLYKIDLPDGDYIIRKLTPVEAERLQTLPDDYTDCICNTQRYKTLGNGWTVDVIAHILGFLKTL